MAQKVLQEQTRCCGPAFGLDAEWMGLVASSFLGCQGQAFQPDPCRCDRYVATQRERARKTHEWQRLYTQSTQLDGTTAPGHQQLEHARTAQPLVLATQAHGWKGCDAKVPNPKSRPQYNQGVSKEQTRTDHPRPDTTIKDAATSQPQASSLCCQ